MPTGYTHDLISKKLSFPQFALTCARAFGAFIHMRDDDWDAPLRPVKVSDYHLRSLKEAQAKLATLIETPVVQFRAKAKAEHAASVTMMAGIRKTYSEENALLEAMSVEVRAWTPPTSDHQALKAFMLQQIETSMHDLSPRASEDDSRAFPTKTEALDKVREDIAYHEKEHAEEVARVKAANDWAKALKESLP